MVIQVANKCKLMQSCLYGCNKYITIRITAYICVCIHVGYIKNKNVYDTTNKHQLIKLLYLPLKSKRQYSDSIAGFEVFDSVLTSK